MVFCFQYIFGMDWVDLVRFLFLWSAFQHITRIKTISLWLGRTLCARFMGVMFFSIEEHFECLKLRSIGAFG